MMVSDFYGSECDGGASVGCARHNDGSGETTLNRFYYFGCQQRRGVFLGQFDKSTRGDGLGVVLYGFKGSVLHHEGVQ
jgi:hypothetical protein